MHAALIARNIRSPPTQLVCVYLSQAPLTVSQKTTVFGGLLMLVLLFFLCLICFPYACERYEYDKLCTESNQNGKFISSNQYFCRINRQKKVCWLRAD